MRIEIVAFDGMEELDAVGPWQVLRLAQRFAAVRGTGWDVRLVGIDSAQPVTCAHGLRVAVDGVLGASGPVDGIVVPGGGWTEQPEQGSWQQAQAGSLPRTLAELAPACRWVASVCTGAMLLNAAGLLTGRRAVTHRSCIDELSAAGVTVLAGARVVDDATIVTAGGVTAGIDLALHLVERELGADLARAVADDIEYSRTPAVRTC